MSENPNVARIRGAYAAMERGDIEAFAASLAPDILWHETMPGFAGDYHGRDKALAMLGQVFETTGIELNGLSIEHVLADDTHAMVLLETTVTMNGSQHTSWYVDVYRLRDGTATEHWHFPLDPAAEAELYGG